jgi:hypothetical protein
MRMASFCSFARTLFIETARLLRVSSREIQFVRCDEIVSCFGAPGGAFVTNNVKCIRTASLQRMCLILLSEEFDSSCGKCLRFARVNRAGVPFCAPAEAGERDGI